MHKVNQVPSDPAMGHHIPVSEAVLIADCGQLLSEEEAEREREEREFAKLNPEYARSCRAGVRVVRVWVWAWVWGGRGRVGGAQGVPSVSVWCPWEVLPPVGCSHQSSSAPSGS